MLQVFLLKTWMEEKKLGKRLKFWIANNLETEDWCQFFFLFFVFNLTEVIFLYFSGQNENQIKWGNVSEKTL